MLSAGNPMRIRHVSLLLALLFGITACGGSSVDLPRDAEDMPEYTEPAEFERTGKEFMPLDNIAADLEPHWQEVESCEQVGYTSEINDKTYRNHLLFTFDRSTRRTFDLACEMEQHGYYVSHVARVRKETWSDYDKRFVPSLFTFFRIRSADGSVDFVTYHATGYHNAGNVQLGGCNHDENYCYFLYRPSYVINMHNGLYRRFSIVRRQRNEHYEDSGPVALLLGKEMPEVSAFVSGESDGIPRALALRALVREVQRQYPEAMGQALDLYGYVRPMRDGIVIEDVGANLGMAGTDASYLIKLTEDPECEPTDNAQVRQCTLTVKTSFRAYNRASGSTQTKVAQIANVAAAGKQSGTIEALFIQDDSGWRMVVTEQIARFLSGVDRKNDWVVRTSDGRTLSGAPAVSCIANPRDC
jgi:hypothetical protein